MYVCVRACVCVHMYASQVGDARLAFSDEILAAERARGWARRTGEPVDVPRRELANEPDLSESDLGSRFSWEGVPDPPCVAGRPVDVAPPLSWPRFAVSPALPAGLELDPETGRITGRPVAATGGEYGEWTVRVWSPVGAAEAALRMRVMAPPAGLAYATRIAGSGDYILVHNQDMGVLSCR
jgi:hypothetical protein